MIIEKLLPGWFWILNNQQPVLWIYLSLLGCLSVRVWLTLRVLSLPRSQRTFFLNKTNTLSELVINVPVLLGVLGTLVGITLAISGKTGGVSPQKFLELFSQAFNVAVGTTIAGGLTYIACFFLSSWDEHLADDKE